MHIPSSPSSCTSSSHRPGNSCFHCFFSCLPVLVAFALDRWFSHLLCNWLPVSLIAYADHMNLFDKSINLFNSIVSLSLSLRHRRVLVSKKERKVLCVSLDQNHRNLLLPGLSRIALHPTIGVNTLKNCRNTSKLTSTARKFIPFLRFDVHLVSSHVYLSNLPSQMRN